MKPIEPTVHLNIVLADDDIDDRQFFEKALIELKISFDLTSLNDGEELMTYLLDRSSKNKRIDVLFLDLNMPRKNGFECLSEIKQNETLKYIPIVMFSTSYPRDKNYEQDMVNTLLKIGALDFIRKSSDFSQLKNVIQHSLNKAIEGDSLKNSKLES